ncbi:MAG: DUF507 family protein [Terriglobales bacterium]
MRIEREFVSYLAREVTRRLLAAELISATHPAQVIAWVQAAMAEEFAVEDKINEEARAILAQHEAEMQRLGASYSDAFKKIKNELVKQKKVVL